MEMLSECGDVLDIQSNGSRRVVTPLEFLQHALSKLGHHKRLLSVMNHFMPSKLRGFSAAKRLRSTGDITSLRNLFARMNESGGLPPGGRREPFSVFPPCCFPRFRTRRGIL